MADWKRVEFEYKGNDCVVDARSVGTPDECNIPGMPDEVVEIRWIADPGWRDRDLENAAVDAFRRLEPRE